MSDQRDSDTFGAERPAGKAFRDGTLGKALDAIDRAFQTLESAIPHAQTAVTPTVVANVFTVTAGASLYTIDGVETVTSINGGSAGQMIMVWPKDAGDVTLTHGLAANGISCPGGVSIVLAETTDAALLIHNGSLWNAVAVSNVAAANSGIAKILSLTTNGNGASRVGLEAVAGMAAANVQAAVAELAGAAAQGLVTTITPSAEAAGAPDAIDVTVAVRTLLGDAPGALRIKLELLEDTKHGALTWPITLTVADNGAGAIVTSNVAADPVSVIVVDTDANGDVAIRVTETAAATTYVLVATLLTNGWSGGTASARLVFA